MSRGPPEKGALEYRERSAGTVFWTVPAVVDLEGDTAQISRLSFCIFLRNVVCCFCHFDPRGVFHMEKLYQQDPFLTRFTAQVVSCAADKGGGLWCWTARPSILKGRAALGHRYAERHPSHPGPGAGWSGGPPAPPAWSRGLRWRGCRLGAALRPDAAALRGSISSPD